MLKKHLSGFKTIILNILSRYPHWPILRKAHERHLLKTGKLLSLENLQTLLETANPVHYSFKDKKPNVALIRDRHYSNNLILKRAYWPKYERFLKTNQISYSILDISLSDWRTNLIPFDIIVWSTPSDPDKLEEAKAKIFFIERYLKKKCFPSYDSIWSYEEKIKWQYIYEQYKLPAINTFVSFSREESLKYITNSQYPIVSKLNTGSSSQGVRILKNKKQALKLVQSIFSNKGSKTYFPFIRQKGYVYFQEFIEDATFDLRIILVGSKVFGYFRYPKNGDFRASGSGIVVKKELPSEAIEISERVRNISKSPFLAVDLLYSEKRNKYLIIETSVFIGIESPSQAAINGITGYFQRNNKQFIFMEGKFWLQELCLQEFMKEWESEIIA